ncbi:hypothetical protein [Streptomyces viridochromogenes]|uniref:hypothetical protein n=1 Tax=Streptomyces viridochromogenes TaxID=1938 RepID=UPI00131A0847|nr:hypothetical protein [Streptomyces viridochromogenes]
MAAQLFKAAACAAGHPGGVEILDGDRVEASGKLLAHRVQHSAAPHGDLVVKPSHPARALSRRADPLSVRASARWAFARCFSAF